MAGDAARGFRAVEHIHEGNLLLGTCRTSAMIWRHGRQICPTWHGSLSLPVLKQIPLVPQLELLVGLQQLVGAGKAIFARRCPESRLSFFKLDSYTICRLQAGRFVSGISHARAMERLCSSPSMDDLSARRGRCWLHGLCSKWIAAKSRECDSQLLASECKKVLRVFMGGL